MIINENFEDEEKFFFGKIKLFFWNPIKFFLDSQNINNQKIYPNDKIQNNLPNHNIQTKNNNNDDELTNISNQCKNTNNNKNTPKKSWCK